MAVAVDIGIMGGAFDPIHVGHLAAAEEARVTLGLREVLFIPSGQPYFNGKQKVLAVEHRVAMVRLAIAPNPHFKLSTMEIERTGESYSVDTLEELHRRYEDGRRWFFILGMDALLTLPHWKEPDRLIQLCHLVVANRPEFTAQDIELFEETVPGISQHITFLETPSVDVSSTDIRQRRANGQSIHNLIPSAVEEYILEHGLYR